MNRREFIKRFVVSSALIGTSASAAYELLVRFSNGQGHQAVQTIQQQSTQNSQGSSTATSLIQTPSGYVFITAVSAIGGRSSAYFNHPTYGNSLLINLSGQWKAFSATCTHQPCTVDYSSGSSIRCPCHGATFSTSNGAVLGGPAPRPLPEYGVQVDANGNLFVTAGVIN
ncbi:MAG: Rieske (2Fe-2S) protein [Thaumarchaeota archaeon]|nr:Rieske (2Fe-2S) protein [Nitrososphaerota archaeon]